MERKTEDNVIVLERTKPLYVRDGKFIYFGEYPQSEVLDKELISVLNSKLGTLPSPLSNENWRVYNYYKEGVRSNYSWFIDLSYKGKKYRGVYFIEYRPNMISLSANEYNNQKGNGYRLFTTYWFKYEPIKWRILKEEGNNALLLCENIIDGGEYFDSKSERIIDNVIVYPNNYEYSNIRKFLNNDFYNTAFTTTQKQIIKLTAVDNSERSANPDNNSSYYLVNREYICKNTLDHVFLLSQQEVTSASLGFNEDCTSFDTARQRKATAYAKCQGVFSDSDKEFLDNGWWWLRSPHYDIKFDARGVNSNGYADYYFYLVLEALGGVVPSLTINIC